MIRPESQAGRPTEQPPLTVLIAEDEEDLAEAIELTVADMGHHPIRVRDGRSALAAVQKVHPDVLLLDLSMPVLDGFGVLQAIGEGHEPAPPVVAMSAFDEFLVRTPELGATATLRKPFRPDQLEQVLTSVIGAGARPTAPVASQPVAPAQDDQLERVRAAFCARITGSSPNAVLDALVRAAARLLRTDMALVSIVTDTRQWWKAMHGIGGALAAARGTARDLSFCTHAVAAEAPLVVADAQRHPIFRDNALVKDGVMVSYAGVPIRIPSVGALGTLCVLDRRPRVFSNVDLELLALLAARASAEIEWSERDPDDPRPAATCLQRSLVDEQYDIYTPHAFAAYAGVIARLALAEDGPFGLCGLTAPARTMPSVIAAARQAVGEHEAIGWLDNRSVAVVLPRADEPRVRAFVEQVTAAVGPEIRHVSLVERGALTARVGLARLRSQLLRQTRAGARV
jgi:CheY-like chemotaxis protein